jgi:acyl-CoA synthetase (AMP-forming)/AMP-acid ligase II
MTFPGWANIEVRTVPGLLRDAVERCSDRAAVVAASGGDAMELTEVTYAQLAERAERFATGLRELGVAPGDRVAVLADNRWLIDAVTAYHASHLLGAVNVALNGRWVARELATGLALVTPRVVLCGAPWYDMCAEAVRSVPFAARVAGFESLAGRPPLRDGHRVGESDDADWVFTSGTTGDPKAVRFTHGQSVATALQVAHAWSLRAGDLYQSPSPYFTSTGCRTNLLGSLAAGATYLPEPTTDLERILEIAHAHRPTVYFGVSAMFRLLLDRARDRLDALKSLRRLVYGGMVMPTSFHEELNAAFEQERGIEVMHLMGLTEGGPTGVYLRPGDHARKPGAVGDRGFSPWTETSVGDTGELYLRSPSATSGVLTADGVTTDPRQDGWLPTGDIVSVDGDGFLYFVDRKRDLIRRGGMNIASGEVEAVFKQHPAVAEMALVAKPHRVLGEDLCAFVVAKDGDVDTADLRAFAAERLADYKVPRDIRIVAELPTNSMGRVRKGTLRQSLAGE